MAFEMAFEAWADKIEAASCIELCRHKCGRHHRLGMGIRLGRLQHGQMAVRLVQILGDGAADHGPKGYVDFNGNHHRRPLRFW